jgi:hypothetical protein
MSWNRWSVVIVAGLGLALVNCNALKEETPTEPTSPSPAATLVPIAIPVVLPTPKPTPVPTPTPSTPAPTPTPDPGTPTGSCSLPASNPANPVCTDDGTQFLDQMETAITAVTTNHPEYFDFNDKKCDDCYYVKNVDGYLNGVIKQLNKQSVCALWDGEEMAVKGSNKFSEQWDILLATGHIRRGPKAYRGTCRPAIF